MLKIGSTGSPARAIQSITTVVGQKYHVVGYLYDSDVTEGAMTMRIGTTSGGNEVAESSGIGSSGVWTLVEMDFEATATTTYITIQKITGGAVTVYGDNISVKAAGCVLYLGPDGINAGQDMVYDASTNNLDATNHGSEFHLTPSGSDVGFHLAEFTEADDRYWFVKFNLDGVTGTAGNNLSLGQVLLGRVFAFTGFDPDGGYSGEYGYPGVIIQETDAGRVQAEQKYGRKPTWDLQFALSSQSDLEDFQAMLDTVRNGLYPFYVCFDWDTNNPVLWRVRLDGGLEYNYKYGPSSPWKPSLRLVADI